VNLYEARADANDVKNTIGVYAGNISDAMGIIQEAYPRLTFKSIELDSLNVGNGSNKLKDIKPELFEPK